MCLFVVLSALILVEPPDPGGIPTLSAGESTVVRPGSDGYGWVRVLEDDYICLRLSTDTAVGLAVYDNEGNLLVAAPPGEDAVVSAFSDYWFNIRADMNGVDELTITVSEEPGSWLSTSRPVEGALSIAEMADVYTFIPPSRGRWQVLLRGGSTTDLDIEVYGPRMNLWTGGYSDDGSEKVIVHALPSDTLIVVISRYNKSGSGEYALEVKKTGDFTVLAGMWIGIAESDSPYQRVMIGSGRDPALLRLSCAEPEADLDLYVQDCLGNDLWGSSSYSASEALLLPPDRDSLVAQIVAFDFGEAERLRFQLSVEPLPGFSEGTGASGILQAGDDPPLGFFPDEAGFYIIAAVFDKLRNGDVSLFRGPGEPSITFSTDRGDERFLAWIGGSETVWLYPWFDDVERTGVCTLSITRVYPQIVDSCTAGSTGDSSGNENFYTTEADADEILVIRLDGDDRETDLDMLVSGPGYDLTAEGWMSSVDAAGDESVAFCPPEDAVYGITVYAYEREISGGYSLNVERIPRTEPAIGTTDSEIWALVAGISGYEASEDVLNRASMDAVDMYSFLTRERDVPPNHVTLLVDAMATADAFRNSLEALLSQAGPEDIVIVFFSGHGNQLEPGSGGPEESDSANECICLYDGDIEDDWLAGIITEESSVPVLLFIDACHSGGLVNDFDKNSDVLVLTAAREDRSVSERILTPILLEGLRGAGDGNRDGILTAGELASYVDIRLQRICPECDSELDENSLICPECGAVLKGDNRVPRPEQGVFLDPDLELWHTENGKASP